MSTTRPMSMEPGSNGPASAGAARGPRRHVYSPFIPDVVLATAFVAWLGFQCWQLVAEHRQLNQARAQLEAAFESSTKLRASLDGIAAATAKLAEQGNANARVIVDELRRRGVTINPDGSAKRQ